MSLPQTYKILYGPEKLGEPYRFEQIPIPELTSNQILVKMHYAPLNPSDIMVLTGKKKYTTISPHPAGLEGSGTVAAIGPDLKLPHKVGDKVHVMGYGTYGEYVVAEADLCSPIKGDLSFEEAASHFINPGTVYYMGKLAEGHKAAIHTLGASALGRILIRYFKHKGIKLINIVRKEEQIEELKAEGADYVLNSQSPDFEAQLKEIAYKENATFGLDPISGDFSAKIIRNMPPKSTLYIYGSLSGQAAAGISGMDLRHGKKVGGIFVFDYLDEVREEGKVQEFWDELHSLLPVYFKTKVEKVFKVEQIGEALEYYKENSSKGKILITLN